MENKQFMPVTVCKVKMDWFTCGTAKLACVARRSSQSRREKRPVKPRKWVGERSEPRGEWAGEKVPFPSLLSIPLAARFNSLTDSFSHRRSFLPSRLTGTPSYTGYCTVNWHRHQKIMYYMSYTIFANRYTKNSGCTFLLFTVLTMITLHYILVTYLG